MKRLLGLFLAVAGIAFGQPTSPISNARFQGTSLVNSGASLAPSAGGTLTANAFTNAAAMSGALDLIGSTRGSLLYRGASLWTALTPGTAGYVLTSGGAGADPTWTAEGHLGTVTSVSVVTANGVSGSVANPTTTPAITLTLGAITPSSVVAGNITDSALTAGRVTFAGTAGLLTDDADLTFATDTLTFTKGIAPTSLLVGATTAPSLNGSASVFTTVDTAATLPRGISNVQYSTDVNSANFSGYKARGTQSSPTIVAASDILTNFRAWGYDGSGVSAGYLNMGSLRFRVPSGTTPAATSVPTEAVLSIGTNATPSVLTDTIVASSTTGIALTALGTNQNISLSTNGSGAVTVPNATATSSTTTGAFQVTGGVGIAAGLNVGGAISQGIDPAGTALGTGLHLSDNTRSTIQLDTYSSTAGNGPFILARHAGGTFASPSQTPSSASLFTVSGRGYDNSGAFTTSTASIGYTTSEAFTSSAHGTYIIFSGTTAGTTTLSEISRFVDGNILVGTVSGTGLTGAGGLKLNSSTTSTSTATGSFVTAGGVGIAGALFVGTSGATISGGAGNMTLVSGTGASRTMTLQTTTSGSAATTFMSADATQNITVSNKITSYNGIATAGNGVVTVQGAGRATAQVAANASVATYTVGAADASFVVSANVKVTTSSAEAFTVTCAYTDEGNTSRTITMNFQLVAGTIGTAINFANGAVPYEGIPVHIRAKASSAITIATTGTFTGSTYNVEGVIQKLQ